MQANIDPPSLVEEAKHLVINDCRYCHSLAEHTPVASDDKSEVWYSESAEQIAANLLEVFTDIDDGCPRLYDVL